MVSALGEIPRQAIFNEYSSLVKDRLNKIKQQRRGYGTKRKRTNIPRAYKR